MKIVFKAASNAPDFYSFFAETIISHKDDEQVEYHLSSFPEDGIFTGAEKLPSGAKSIRGIKRVNGELYVTLVQKVIAGQYPGRKARWRGIHTIDSADYDPNTCYVFPTGMAGVDDYEIVQGVDVAGNTGWTVRKKEMADG